MQTNNRPADPSLFNTFVPLHGFQQGMKIEAADLMDPRLVCIATVAKVAGRLLKVIFVFDLIIKSHVRCPYISKTIFAVFRCILTAGKKNMTNGWIVKALIFTL